MKDSIRFLVFDIESVADAALVALTRTGGEQGPAEAVSQYRAELIEQRGSDFIPYTFQVPISLALAKIRDDY
ncbi:MAG: 3'-5' exonuclease, partial [Thermoguttaceae bacterium]|nr:3'-5' exonuclease [Thermoguttaceae bacterium]